MKKALKRKKARTLLDLVTNLSLFFSLKSQNLNDLVTLKKADRTYLAVKKQLDGFKTNDFELGIYNRSSNKMLARFWTKSEILKSLNWLKSMNHKGSDVFIRPSGSVGLVFFDDVTQATITDLKNNGFDPAIITESSPQNYQGWIRVSEHEIDSDLATCICKVIAKMFNGDIDSADWRHYGRLAGFTNQKPKYVDSFGRQPFVLLTSYSGRQATNAKKLLELGKEQLKQRKQELVKRRKALLEKTVINTKLRDCFAFYQSELTGLSIRYGSNLDNSRADWMIVTKMIERGYTREDIISSMRQFSPALVTRLGHTENYINLTVNKAFGLVSE